MKCLEYPFEGEFLLKKKKSLKRELMAQNENRIIKKIAVLGGSTTREILEMTELFLLNHGVEPCFYESEYNQYYEEAMFPNEKLEAFAPDVIFIHTSNRNISAFPTMADSKEQVDALLNTQMDKFTAMWDRLREVYKCPIIQNNMELPLYRLLGNKDGVDFHGKTSFIRRLNQRFADYAASHDSFYIHDLEYLAASYGMERFSDPFYWHMYKYCMCVPAIPTFAYSLSNILKSLFGKNKKGLVLDLDNTLWGGVIGDDGQEGIEIGPETSMGQVYSEFQSYIRELKQIGVVLAVNSKNDMENALLGLSVRDTVLTADDFACIKANWQPKDRNFAEIAQELSLLPESLVFVDDNPVEREIVTKQIPGVLAPPMEKVEQYAGILDKAGYFETTTLSADDLKRNDMYRENAKRMQLQSAFASYEDYLVSLEMKAIIKAFDALSLPRITQLTNKSNQFNLTTRRYTQKELEEVVEDDRNITLYGRLEDRFGDNGIVSVVCGHEDDSKGFHIDLWLMSCRVLKRDMECAMMDMLVEKCKERGLTAIYGYYYPTAKNSMVCKFFEERGFTLFEEDNGNTVWYLDISGEYKKQNHVIEIKGDKDE